MRNQILILCEFLLPESLSASLVGFCSAVRKERKEAAPAASLVVVAVAVGVEALSLSQDKRRKEEA